LLDRPIPDSHALRQYRGRAKPQPFTEILLEGLAPDGACFCGGISEINLADLSAMRRIATGARVAILRSSPTIFSPETERLVDKTYRRKSSAARTLRR